MTAKLSTFARVRGLSGWRAAAFAAVLLERMEPNYRFFAQLAELEEPNLLRNVLDLVWESLKHPKARVNFALQLEKVEAATPDIAEYDMFGVYPAVDASMAMCALLNLLLEQDPQGAVVVSKLSQGSVEAFLLSQGEAQDDTVKAHPLMAYEVELQNELLDIVESQQDKLEACAALTEAALSEQMTNIGLALED